LHPGAWKAFSKAGFWAPPWLSAVGMPGWLMEAVNPVPGGQDGGSALAGLAATPTAASAPTNRSAAKRRLMKHTPSFRPPQRRRANLQAWGRVEQACRRLEDPPSLGTGLSRLMSIHSVAARPDGLPQPWASRRLERVAPGQSTPRSFAFSGA
jgi:hypothetical protein